MKYVFMSQSRSRYILFFPLFFHLSGISDTKNTNDGYRLQHDFFKFLFYTHSSTSFLIFIFSLKLSHDFISAVLTDMPVASRDAWKKISALICRLSLLEIIWSHYLIQDAYRIKKNLCDDVYASVKQLSTWIILHITSFFATKIMNTKYTLIFLIKKGTRMHQKIPTCGARHPFFSWKENWQYKVIFFSVESERCLLSEYSCWSYYCFALIDNPNW